VTKLPPEGNHQAPHDPMATCRLGAFTGLAVQSSYGALLLFCPQVLDKNQLSKHFKGPWLLIELEEPMDP